MQTAIDFKILLEITWAYKHKQTNNDYIVSIIGITDMSEWSNKYKEYYKRNLQNFFNHSIWESYFIWSLGTYRMPGFCKFTFHTKTKYCYAVTVGNWIFLRQPAEEFNRIYKVETFIKIHVSTWQTRAPRILLLEEF